MILRLILFALSIFLFYYSYASYKKGSIYIKETTFEKEENSFLFWISIVIIFVFGLILLYFSIFGKVK